MKIFAVSIVTLLALSFLGCASTPPKGSGHSHASSLFQWPVSKAKLTQPFRFGPKKHNGLDLAAPQNTPIYSIASGKVIYVGQSFRGFGKMVLIEHDGPEKWASLYAHLNRFKVREGQSVSKGSTIGLMGKTGNASGTHLHFELRYNKRPVDPMKVLPKEALRR